jgi:hypothetical protein
MPTGIDSRWRPLSRDRRFIMRFGRSTPVLAVGLLLLCAASSRSDAAESGLVAADIIQKLKVALNPARTSERDLEIVTDVPGGPPVSWQGRQLRRTIDGGRSILTLLASPPSVAGFAVLATETASKNDATWVYVPPVRRVRKIVHPGRYEYFLGTDLSSSDLGFLHFDPSARLADGKVKLEGQDTWVIEEKPEAKPGGYSRIRTWVATDSNLPLRREYHDEAGKLWKTETWHKVETIDGVPTPLEMIVTNVQDNSRTVLRFGEVNYDVTLSDEGFRPETLAAASLSSEPTAGFRP